MTGFEIQLSEFGSNFASFNKNTGQRTLCFQTSLVNVATRHKEAPQTRKCRNIVRHSLTCGCPLFVWPLFGRACCTCLNPPLGVARSWDAAARVELRSNSTKKFGCENRIGSSCLSVRALADVRWNNIITMISLTEQRLSPSTPFTACHRAKRDAINLHTLCREVLFCRRCSHVLH